MSTPPNMEKLLTELEIKNLIVRERYYRDTAQYQNLRDCWHPDEAQTRIKISWYEGDIDGFIAGTKRMMSSSVTNSSHTITPVVVHFNDKGNKAVSESTGNILGRFMHDGVAYDCLSYSLFISRFVNDGNGWRMCSLETIYQKDSLLPVVPGTAKEIKPDPNTRASYRCLGWLLSQGGFKIEQDLPGVDKPGSGEALIEACLKWLHGGQ